MELIFRPIFYREFDNIKNKDILKELQNIFHKIEKADSINEIGNLKKLRNYSHYYRIKIKISDKIDYRLVLMIRNKKVWAESVALSSKVFYKK